MDRIVLIILLLLLSDLTSWLVEDNKKEGITLLRE